MLLWRSISIRGVRYSVGLFNLETHILLFGDVFFNCLFESFFLLHFILLILRFFFFFQMADEPWQAAHARMRHVIITLARRTDLLSDLLCVVISRRVHGWSYSPKSQPAAHVVGAGAGKLYSFGILQWKSDGFSAFSTQPYDSAFFVCFQALNILFSPSSFVFICLCLKFFF